MQSYTEPNVLPEKKLTEENLSFWIIGKMLAGDIRGGKGKVFCDKEQIT